MSLWRDDVRTSRLALIALAVCAAVATASIVRVIDGPISLAWAFPAVAVGATFALTYGRRSLGLAFVALAAVGTLTLPGLFARDATVGLLPTPGAFGDLATLITDGLNGTGQDVAPVPAVDRYLILVWCGLVLAGFLGAAWIVVGRPMGAVVSAIGLVAFTGSVGKGSGRVAFGTAVVGTALAFFLLDGRQRIIRWSGRPTALPRRLGTPTLALACAVMVAAPLTLGASPLFNLSGALRPRLVVIKPLSDVQRQLDVEPPIEVMRVRASQPAYWRLTGLDRYDGTEWVLEARPRLLEDTVVPAPEIPTSGSVLVQEIQLTSLLSPWLPAAYAASAVEAGAPVEVDEASHTLLLRDTKSPGFSYRVESRLESVGRNVAGSGAHDPDEREELFGRLAEPLVADTRSALDAARALEAHFKRFTYDEKVDGSHTTQRLQRFLADRRGYCEQFAATMTLMMRGLGHRARVAVGFLPGTRTGDTFSVSTRDAHAWVEVDLPEVGWTAFDPTPARADAPRPPQPSALPDPLPPPPQPTIVPAATPVPQDLPDEVIEAAGSPDRRPVVAALAVIALAAVVSIKPVRRRARRGRDPTGSIMGALAEFVDAARDLGWRLGSAETATDYGRRLLGTDDDEPAQLFALAGRAQFGASPATMTEAERAWSACGAGLAALRRDVPAWRRVAGALDPRTLLRRSPFTSPRPVG